MCVRVCIEMARWVIREREEVEGVRRGKERRERERERERERGGGGGGFSFSARSVVNLLTVDKPTSVNYSQGVSDGES